MDLLIGEYFFFCLMNLLFIYVVGFESESNKNINIFICKFFVIYFVFLIKCRVCIVLEV